MRINAKEYSAGEILRIIREWTELNRVEFGKSIYRSARGIRAFEQEERGLSVDTLLQIAKVHNINIVISKDEVLSK